MIIWTRWGVLSFFGFGVGVALALGIASLFHLPDGPAVGITVFACAAAVNWVMARWLYPRLDKPRPVSIVRHLPQPYVWPDGRVQTQEVLPVLDPEGKQLWETPSSSLLFIPVRYLWIVFLGVAAVLGVVTAAQALIGG